MWRFKPFMPKEQNGLEGRAIDIGNFKVQVRNVIAEGGFSYVYLARDAIHVSKEYALKHIICNDEESLGLVMKEISVMKSLKGHPNIVTFYAHAILDMGRTKEALLLMEYCEKSLVNVLESRGAGFFEEKQILQIFRDVCNAVFAMHCKTPPIAHRDLKAENLLLGSDGLWKLCDFGSTSTNHKRFEKPEEMGVEEDNIRKHTTPAYRAPEMWDLYRRELINEKVDIWALGCLLFRICYFKSASRCTVKVMNHESPVGGDGEEIDYEGGDEHDENLSMKRDNSDFDLQAGVEDSNEEKYQTFEGMTVDNEYPKELDEDSKSGLEMIRSGHISDPGIVKTEFWASPMLKRSCSDMLIRNVKCAMDEPKPPSKSKSFEEIQNLAERFQDEILDYPPTPVSVMTQRSADKVILKKHSSSQILPSRSRKLWWKLFLWSHRNLHRAGTTKSLPVAINCNQRGGYSSDTIEPRKVEKFSKESKGKAILNIDNQSWDGFYGVSGMWPQNQWVAFPTDSSPFERVDEWVKEVSVQPPFEVNNGDHTEDSIFFPPSPQNNRSPATRSPAAMIPEEITYANSVVQSLNSSSTVAHITGIGLKVIPSVSHFSSLRSVNLSSNSIGHITPGSLPKGLHILQLSKNNISTIEGLRDLTRLRVLDLSYNRISRIGQGLSNCMLIKELYLAGNKISNVEGLHRLLKLVVLDLSFNKITTTKAFGQLVANCNSLVALNLLGNPVHNNIGDDQLRKAICSILPKLVFLNKQTINPQKLREVGSEAIAKAALGNGIRSSRGRAVKKVSRGGSSSSTSLRRSSANAARQSRHGAKTRSNHHSSLMEKSVAFSSRQNS